MVAVEQAPAGGPTPVVLRVRRDLRRDRLTSLFRLLLAIPHLVVLLGLYLAAYVVAVVGWFAALVLGRLPTWVHEFLSGTLRWVTRVNGYAWLLTDHYPPFAWAPTGYPVELAVPPPCRLNRWAVLGRIVLILPAYVITALLNGIGLFVVFAWFAAVFAGRLPRAVFDAIATVLRYQARLGAYLLLLTPTYPWGPVGDGVEPPALPAWTPPGYVAPPGGAVGYPPPPTSPPGYGPSYPPMPPAQPTGPAAARDAAWYDGIVTGGGRAILSVAMVLGAAGLAENGVGIAAGGLTGGFGGFGGIRQTFDLTRDKASFDAALDGASCPTPGAACTQQVATRLLDASGHLSRDVDAADSGAAQRARLGADLQAFDAAVRGAAADGSLVDASGSVTDYRVLTIQTRVDQDVQDLIKALR